MLREMMMKILVKKMSREMVRELNVSTPLVVPYDLETSIINAVYYENNPFVGLASWLAPNSESGYVLIDKRFYSLRYLKSLKSVLAHEFRHHWQSTYRHTSMHQSLVHLAFVNHWEGLDYENPLLYAWHEIDARAWSAWYVSGKQGPYVEPPSDEELWRQSSHDMELFRKLVLARYEQYPKLEMEYFGQDEEALLELGESIAVLKASREAEMDILEWTESDIMEMMMDTAH